MVSDHITVTASVKISWWVRPYYFAVLLFARLHGLQPDPEKICRVMRRGVKLEFRASTARTPPDPKV